MINYTHWMMLNLLQGMNNMGTVLQIKSEAYPVQDIDDVLELIRKDMGDDIYYYVQDYIDELKQEIDSIMLEEDEYIKSISNDDDIVNNIKLP